MLSCSFDFFIFIELFILRLAQLCFQDYDPNDIEFPAGNE